MQKIVFRVVMIIFHLFQAVISITANAYISAVIGAFLLGAYLNDHETIKRLFYAKPIVISIVGSIVWFLIVVVEFTKLK